MITCVLQGSLGNHMFQIASTYSLALDNNDSCYFNLHRADGIQHRHPTVYIPNIYRNLKITNDAIPPISFTYNSFKYNKIPYKPNCVLRGFFQSELYFSHNRGYILSLFEETEDIRKYILNKYSDILEDSVSVHIRRGDYISFSDTHPQQNIEWYKNAVKIMGRKNVLVFSDDMQWCKNNFPNSFHFIEEEDFYSLYIMSFCNDNIICNSTFGWWGAWLNKNKNRVIAPKKWFGDQGPRDYYDIYCKGWIIL